MVQEKVGTMRFAAEYSRIRQGILTVRRDRRTTNALQVSVVHYIISRRARS
jgi:U3 small nucleolar RNA-associated protein 20